MKKNTNIIVNFIDDECFILDSAQQKSHHLNSVASWVWNKLDTSSDPSVLSKMLSNEFDITIEQAILDVKLLLKQFKEMGLLVED